MPKTYRLRIAETVEAIQVTHQNALRAAIWCTGILIEDLLDMNEYTGVLVPTLEGAKPAYINGGDYIVKNGEFKVMTAEEFDKTYELLP